MTTHRANFEAWYKQVLEGLYPCRDAGFAILLIAFPLLERYLRQKTRLTPEQNLSKSFFNELSSMFPELRDEVTAGQFWQIFRNGLLHQITLSRQNRSGAAMPIGWLSHDKARIAIEPDGSIWLHPVEFTQHVVRTIEADFPTFEGAVGSPQLPKVHIQVGTLGTGAPPYRNVLGTNTGP